MKDKIEVSLGELEKLSLEALSEHCPLCGEICKDLYCPKCDFKYEKGKLYFSNTPLPLDEI